MIFRLYLGHAFATIAVALCAVVAIFLLRAIYAQPGSPEVFTFAVIALSCLVGAAAVGALAVVFWMDAHDRRAYIRRKRPVLALGTPNVD